MLAEDRDRALQRADGLERILLLRVELRELLLAELRGLVQRGLVLGDLRREVLDLSVETRARPAVKKYFIMFYFRLKFA